MATLLTVKERKHADLWLETGNGTKAAREAYNASSDNVAASISSQNLRKLKVQAYIQGKAALAAKFVFELASSSQNDGVRLSASKDILDRAGLQAASKSESVSIVEHHVSGGIVIAQLAEKVSSELANRKLKQAD